MHQPYYRDDLTKECSMPWVRLHGIKDYLDMLLILKDYPSIKQTFNFSPSLLDQIQAYVDGSSDKYLDLSRIEPAKLTHSDKEFMLLNFFSANWHTMVKPYPRYYDLLLKRGKILRGQGLDSVIKIFSDRDFLDLQVWFNLSWIDPMLRAADKDLSALLKKGADFSQDDLRLLLNKQADILQRIIPEYTEFQNSGQVELIASPFFHPILPLLCDTDCALEAMPEAKLPENRFRHPDDAKSQIDMAIASFKNYFNKPPAGMWPSEGSVSKEVAGLFSDALIEWIATDEEILYRSLGSDSVNIYKPYYIDSKPGNVNIVFRDHALSDSIGFIYKALPAQTAVDDFMSKLLNIYNDNKNRDGEILVNVILDGENAWEYYPNDGHDFLTLLYNTFTKTDWLSCVTVSEFIKKFPPKDKIENLAAGSWIGGNFAIWIAQEQKNTSWDYLSRARDMLIEFQKKNPDFQKGKIEKAWRFIYICEGSDWNWWYGPDHSTSFDDEFDRLYRHFLSNVWQLVGKPVPDYLNEPIIPTEIEVEEPIGLISPSIDGVLSNYYEWSSAGHFDASSGGGAMHQAENIVKGIYYGFDLENFYLRLDMAAKTSEEFGSRLNIDVNIKSKEHIKFQIQIHDSKIQKANVYVLKNANKWQAEGNVKSVAWGEILEAKLEFKILGLRPQAKADLWVSVTKDNHEIERLPKFNNIYFEVPDKYFGILSWTA